MVLSLSAATLEAPPLRIRIDCVTAVSCSVADDVATILPTAAVLPNGTGRVSIPVACRHREGVRAAIMRPVETTVLEEMAVYARAKFAWQDHTARFAGAFERVLNCRLTGARTRIALRMGTHTYWPPDCAQSVVSYMSTTQPETEEERAKRIAVAVEKCMIGLWKFVLGSKLVGF